MGKKSLTQSTTKKKSDTATKKGTKKKTPSASAKNKTTKSETTRKTAKSQTAKKTAKGTTTKKTAKAASAKKTAPKTAKKPSLKTLRKKKFDTWTPADPYVPQDAPEREKAFADPAVTEDYAPEQAEKVRGLLLKKIDLTTPEPTAAAPEAPAAPAKDPEPAPQAQQAPEPAITAESENKPKKPADDKKPAKAAGSKKDMPKAPEKKVSDSGRPPVPPAPTEPPGGGGGGEGKEPLPISRGLLGLIVVVGLLLALLIGASLQNMDNYYLKQTHNALEIWRGDFSPRGKNKIAVLQGAKAPAEIRDAYSREQALTYAYNYYMEKAGALSEASDLPDFKAIRTYLGKAGQYAVAEAQKNRVNKRLDHIEYLTLLFKAEVAAEKQTTESLQTALDYLEQALALQITEAEQKVVSQRIEYTRAALEELQEQQKAASEEPEHGGAGTGDSAGSGSEEDTGNEEQRPESAESGHKTF